jgi:hypothetical protein
VICCGENDYAVVGDVDLIRGESIRGTGEELGVGSFVDIGLCGLRAQ